MLHRALRNQPPGEDLCTVCLVAAAISPAGAQLTVTLAGHPQPLLIGPGGNARQIGRPGTLLGVLERVDVSECSESLATGETLLLYTDGVPDAGRPRAPLGEDGLIELCRAAPGSTLRGLLERIESAARARAGGHPRDDLALLAMRLR
jgi:serine phosphatase RsbU (regulator of sigma subunit)